MPDSDLVDLGRRVARAVNDALSQMDRWDGHGERPGQYSLDLVADAAALEILGESGLGVLSEESGRHWPDRELVAVLDPVDGSTNASRRLPWYAMSMCVVDGDGPRVAVVVNLASGVEYTAIRGGGAFKTVPGSDAVAISPSGTADIGRSIIALSGYPGSYFGWAQYRSLGAAALDLCAVADGSLDGFVVAGHSQLAPWDYLGAFLVCSEAGAVMADLDGLDLVTLEHDDRRSIVAGGSAALKTVLAEKAIADRQARGISNR